jgi:hypothetical protein
MGNGTFCFCKRWHGTQPKNPPAPAGHAAQSPVCTGYCRLPADIGHGYWTNSEFSLLKANLVVPAGGQPTCVQHLRCCRCGCARSPGWSTADAAFHHEGGCDHDEIVTHGNGSPCGTGSTRRKCQCARKEVAHPRGNDRIASVVVDGQRWPPSRLCAHHLSTVQQPRVRRAE